MDNCKKAPAVDAGALRRMRLFRTASDSALAGAVKHVRFRDAARGEMLFRKGDDALRFYGVVSGWVKLFNYHINGDEAVLGVFAAGETFAEAALFMGGPYPANAQAVEQSRLIEFDRAYFGREIYNHPELCGAMLASLSGHVKRLVKDVEQLKLRSGRERLALFLHGLCGADSGPCEIDLPYDKSLIAARLGMKAETLSRMFAQLRADGVRVKGARVYIEDAARLRRRAV
ncbi:MAG: Crp/Fnr family transcriptional regulator [Rhodospirillales bacterium]